MTMYMEPELQSPQLESALDHLGNQLYVYDLVKVIKIPDFYLNEPVEEDSDLIDVFKGYIGCYGLIKYNRRPDADNIIKWVDKNGMFLVDVIKIEENVINVFDFCLPPDCIERLEFNFLIYSAFSSFQLPITKESYDKINNVKNIMSFNLIKSILTTPYEELKKIQFDINSKFPQIVR